MTSGIYEPKIKILRGYFLDMLKAKLDYNYIIFYGEKPIGNISISRKNLKTFELHLVIGEKKYWGRGLGTEAIRKALFIAFHKLNYKRAYLEVRPDNKRAIALYKKCGFRLLGIKKYKNNIYQPKVLKMSLIKNKK